MKYLTSEGQTMALMAATILASRSPVVADTPTIAIAIGIAAQVIHQVKEHGNNFIQATVERP